LLSDPCVIPVAPVGRRQVRPSYAARNQVFAIVVQHAKKFVIGLKNATFEIPDENSDDVGVDQAPDFRFAFCEIAVGVRKRQRALLLRFKQAHVFDGDRRLVGEGLEKRDLLVVEQSDLHSPY
jgi:hypothetical protein